ncbi:MAG TPA: MBL fold metallo-hydrolase [Bacillota bacterium]|nr:MBL fold metallo-hydrolase [Bacillota bacterium]
MKVQFCGAATGVTGSCHMVSTEKHSILLDCGLFQGGASEDAQNYEDFPFNPADIECVVLSHAHIDHCGRLPLLVKRGFKGKIYATTPTAELLDVMLKDSAHIQEQEAIWQNRKAQRAGKPLVEPLYTTQDAEDTLKFVVPVLYDTLVEINDQMKIVFNEAGHILGSAIIELWVTEDDGTCKMVFSGDLGMVDRPILRDPVRIKKADYVILEATYGDRLHEPNPISIERLIDIIAHTTKRGGNVVIPSFAVGRTQELIFELNKVWDGSGPMHDALKDVPVYVDSPMAIEATEIFKHNAQVYDEEMKSFLLAGDHPLDFPNIHFTKTSEESQRINFDTTPKVIISASGMCDAGRIRHHLKHNLWNPKSSVVFVGYQAEGSLGRLILNGAEEVKLFGETIKVAAEIHNLEGFSGHADRDGLFNWLCGFEKKPRAIFLVHGESSSKHSFAAFVKEHLGWDCEVVEGVDLYSLACGSDEYSVQGKDAAVAEFAAPEEMRDVRRRLSDIHNTLEDVLYNAITAIQADMPPEQLARIKNVIAALEKDTMDLSSHISV